MPITVEQIGSASVLAYTFSGRITLSDLEGLRSSEAPFFDGLAPGASLAIMLDMTGLYSIPAELFAPLQQSRVVSDRRVRVVSVVGANPYLRALAMSLGLLTARADFVFHPTRADALRELGAAPAHLATNGA